MSDELPLEITNGNSFYCTFANMKILIVSATQMEVDLAKEHLKDIYNIFFLVTGVGMLATAVSLTKYLSRNQPDLVIQVGIAGCFDQNTPLGSVVLVKEEILGDLGVEEYGIWKDLFVIKLIDLDTPPFTKGMLLNQHLSKYNRLGLPTVTAITVNEITTRPPRILQQQLIYNPQIETMEGAALHYVCNDFYIPYLQIRGISNYIGERDKTRWNIREAVENANQLALDLIKSYEFDL